MKKHDIVIIGGGPGGYVAAIRAAQLGMDTALIEAQDLGGVCLNWGCIPTKSLLRSAEILTLAKHANDFGVSVCDVKPDLKAMVKRSRDVAVKLSNGISGLMKKNKIKVYQGYGSLLGQGRIAVSQKGSKDTAILAKNIILATGAHARDLPNLKVDGKDVWGAREAMTANSVPKSLLVIGAGAIGIEFANFYNALGSKVTVVDLAKRILPAEDEEISELAEKSFKSRGIDIITNVKVDKLSKDVARLSNGKKVDAHKVILAVGVAGNTQGFGLEKTKAKVERGHIVTHDFGQSDEPNLYAIGDVAGAPCLAHKASHEGIACVEKIAGKNPHKVDANRIPACTYSSPQIASVGLSEADAKAAGHAVKVGRFPFMANGKALAMGESEGLIKTIFDAKTGELLGAHMIGAEVSEMIQGFAIAIGLETTEQELISTIFAHPTLSEAMGESVLSAYGKTIHF